VRRQATLQGGIDDDDPRYAHLSDEEISDLEALGAVVAGENKPVVPGMMRVDLHCHTQASPDCITPIAAMPRRCLEQGISVQAITDHNVVWGAQRLQKMVAEHNVPLQVIVGEEISTSEGELIGLFLEERVEPRLSPEETVAAIRSQGGLVLLPHGFDPLKRFRLSEEARERIAGQIDVVETFNARISRLRWNRAAVSWAQMQQACMSGGSDAHTLADIGAAWVEVPQQTIAGPRSLLSALDGGVPVGEWTHPFIAYAYKLWDRLRRRASTWLSGG
jgi:predicted metal-dependent phosphoesterase TrpH